MSALRGDLQALIRSQYASFTIVGLTLLAIISIHGRVDNGRVSEQKAFKALIATVGLILLCDIVTWLLSEVAALRLLYRAADFLFYALTSLIIGQWLVYCDCKLRQTPFMARSQLWFFMPWLVFMGLLVANIWTGWIYGYNANGTYYRGAANMLHPLLSGTYMLWSVWLVRKDALGKSHTERKDAYSLLRFLVMPVIALVLQSVFYGLSLVPISLALSLLTLFVRNQAALVTMDPLTGLNNRRMLERYIVKRIGSASEEALLFLVMMDANKFKRINDTYGHQAGNEALNEIARILKVSCHRSDFLARIGGDEFVIAGQRGNEEEVGALVREIGHQLDISNEQSDAPYTLSLSIGAVMFDAAAHGTVDALMDAADREMYRVKRAMR